MGLSYLAAAMWLRKIFPYVFALAFAGASLVAYLVTSRKTLPPAEARVVVPLDAVELWVIRRPAIIAARLNAQPHYRTLNKALDLLALSGLASADQETWFERTELFAYRSNNDDWVLVFGLPAGWTKQEQLHWCLATFNATSHKSGVLKRATEQGDLFFRVEENRCFVSLTDEIPVMNRDRKTMSPLVAAARMGSAFAMVQVLRPAEKNGVVPFIAEASSRLIVRDVYLNERAMSGEEIVVMQGSLPDLRGLPAGWQRMIPAAVTSFDGVGFESGYDLIDFRKAELASQGALAAWNGTLASIESSLGTDAEAALGAWWSGGMARFEAFGHTYVLLGCADRETARRALYAAGAVKQEPFLEGSLLTWEETQLFTHLFGATHSQFMSHAWVNHRSVVFSDGEGALLKLASRVASGQSIDDDHLVARALFRKEGFIRYRQSDAPFNEPLRSLTMPIYESEDPADVTHLLYSGMPAGSDRLVTRFDLSPAAGVGGSATLVWELAVPRLVPSTLASVRNHTTNRFYVVLQDSSNMVHAIDATGGRMWSYNAGGKLLGGFESVDLLRNGKTQVIFATPDGVHCLDVLGRPVQGFPIRPKGAGVKIITPLLVADYDSNRNYRFLFGTSDGKVHNYTPDAKPTRGWSFTSKSSPPKGLAHLRVGTADYVYVEHRDGSIGLLKRSGEPRATTKLTLPPYHGQPQFKITGDIATSSVLVVDTSGALLEGVFGKAGHLNPIMPADAMVLADVNRDRVNDVVAVKGTAVEALGSGGGQLFLVDLKSPISPQIKVYQFASGIGIGVYLSEVHEFVVIDGDGSIDEGSRLPAAGMGVIRDFDGDGTLEVVLPGKGGVLFCYRR